MKGFEEEYDEGAEDGVVELRHRGGKCKTLVRCYATVLFRGWEMDI